MSSINALKRATIEDFPGAPDWFAKYLLFQNSFNEQTFSQVNGGISTANTVDEIVEVDLDHAVETRVKNPLFAKRRAVKGIYPVRCIGVEMSNGRPTRALYELGMPRIDWNPAASSDPQILVTATYPADGQSTGYVGEILGPITRLRSNALDPPTVSGSTYNVCTTTSLTLTPGEWSVGGTVGFNPDPTTSVTRLLAGISLTSATLSGGDTLAVPTLGEYRGEITTAANVMVNDWTIAIPTYPVTVSDGTTKELFLVAFTTFTVAAMKIYGSMQAERTQPYMTGKRGRVSLYFVGG